MIDRIMPIFAVIGILSTAAYLSLAIWAFYSNLNKKMKKEVAAKQVTAH